MAWHLYDVPIIGAGIAENDPRRPKYISALSVPWAIIDYGFQPLCLAAADVSDTDDGTISGRPDAIRVPDNLEGQVGGNPQLNAIQSKLEANFIPGTWVISSTTYREIGRMINGISVLLLRYAVVTEDTTAIFASFTLDSLFSALPLNTQTGLIAAAADLNLSTAAFIPGNTLRAVLFSAGQQQALISRTLGGITL